MTNVKYTLYWRNTGVIIQSGDAANSDRFPAIPDGADILEGVEGDPETECVKNGALVLYQRHREHDELLGAIESERARRLAAGFDYDFQDERGVHRIGTTENDERGWDKVTRLANALIAAGKRNAELVIVTNTGSVTITPKEWQFVLIAAGQFEQPIYTASFALQAMKPIPQDVESDKYWRVK